MNGSIAPAAPALPAAGGAVAAPHCGGISFGDDLEAQLALASPSPQVRLCQLKHSGSMDVAGLIKATGFSQSHISRQLGPIQICSSRQGVSS